MPDAEAHPVPSAQGERRKPIAEATWTLVAWVIVLVVARVSYATESQSPVPLIVVMGLMQGMTFLWITLRFASVIQALAARERRAVWGTTELTAGEYVWQATKAPFLLTLIPAWSAFPLCLGAIFYGCVLNSYAITLAVLCMPMAAAFASIFFLRKIYQLLYVVCESDTPEKIDIGAELRELAGQSFTIGAVAYGVIGVLSIQPPFIVGITVGAFIVGITIRMLTDALFHLREVYPLKDARKW